MIAKATITIDVSYEVEDDDVHCYPYLERMLKSNVNKAIMRGLFVIDRENQTDLVDSNIEIEVK